MNHVGHFIGMKRDDTGLAQLLELVGQFAEPLGQRIGIARDVDPGVVHVRLQEP